MLPEPARLLGADAIRQAAAEVFGFPSLRPGQLEVMREVLEGQPVITVMPTGAGKSLCYQLPAVMLGQTGGVTLVVSPLIALMKDQVDSLRARDIEAAALTSAAGPEEQSDILAGMRGGAFTLVYVAPERFRSPRFLDALAQMGDRLALLAIDEAHCISEWGHDFRPDYRRLGDAVNALRPPRLIALTATATPEVREDIAVQLHMAAPRHHVRGFDRPNLQVGVERAGGAADKCVRLIEKVRMRPGGVALVYAATRKNAERYAEALRESGMRVRAYHAGLDDQARVEAQEAFMGDQLDAIVATNAFGMGVDKSDIRLVIHVDVPRSPEAYYQEAGRGGRDGAPTECVLLFNHADVRLQEFLIDASYPTAEVLRGLWKLLREKPDLGGAQPERLQGFLPGQPHASTVRSATRILLRHGYLRQDGDWLLAVRPDATDQFLPLDVNGLARRADIERDKLRTMVEYAYYPRCRRQYILEYFGDEDWQDRDQRCRACDNCLGVGQAQALTDEQCESVRNLLALVARLSGRFGRARLAALATGSDDDDRFLELPERGLLRGQSSRAVMDLLRALEGAGLVEVSRGDYPTVAITTRGRQAADGHTDLDDIALLVPEPRTRRRSSGRGAGVRAGRGAVADSPELAGPPPDPALVDRLRVLRTELATRQSVPAYVVFSNKTLDAIARQRPGSEAELAAVPGIGPSRLDAYGADILAAVRGD